MPLFALSLSFFLYRHDVAEVANVWAYSFGEEGVDRRVVVFKREYAPSQRHLNALRRGEEWNERVAETLTEEREKPPEPRKRKDDFVPNCSYRDKYRRLIGEEAALAAARKTEANSSYGCGEFFPILPFTVPCFLFFFSVPSENKKDQRSIEQTLADIRAKKKKQSERL